MFNPKEESLFKAAQKWLLPPKGRFKLNIDGAFSEANKSGGIGFILRNDAGEVVHMHADRCKANSSFHCEAKALREALNHVVDKDFGQVIVETDCKGLVEAVQGRSPAPDWQARVHVEEIARMFWRHQNLSLIFFLLDLVTWQRIDWPKVL